MSRSDRWSSRAAGQRAADHQPCGSCRRHRTAPAGPRSRARLRGEFPAEGRRSSQDPWFCMSLTAPVSSSSPKSPNDPGRGLAGWSSGMSVYSCRQSRSAVRAGGGWPGAGRGLGAASPGSRLAQTTRAGLVEAREPFRPAASRKSGCRRPRARSIRTAHRGGSRAGSGPASSTGAVGRVTPLRQPAETRPASRRTARSRICCMNSPNSGGGSFSGEQQRPSGQARAGKLSNASHENEDPPVPTRAFAVAHEQLDQRPAGVVCRRG